MTHSTKAVREKAEIHQLGFWLYLMTDLMLFAAFFATYMILRHGVNGGVGPADIIEPGYVLVQTLLLLTSSFTCGLAYYAVRQGRKSDVLKYLGITTLLGMAFLGMEIYEFSKLYLEGESWQESAFLSSFFGLVGLHGLHITAGVIWAIVLGDYISKKGITDNAVRKFSLFAVFWHFLDLVWIFIFTIVYMMGVIG